MPDNIRTKRKLKAAMRDENTGNLNTSGKEWRGCLLSNASVNGVKRPTGHVEPWDWQKELTGATRLKENHYALGY